MLRAEPYLHFNGCCEAALNFYVETLGGKIAFLTRFGDAPDKSMIAPGTENHVMHATLRLGDSVLMASDGRCGDDGKMSGFSLSLAPATVDEAKRLFDALSAGGSVTMPFAATFWSPGFGMLVDRFGVNWMVNVAQPQ